MSVNLADVLKGLKRVKKGDILEDVVTADLLNSLMDGIQGLCEGQNLRSGLNIRMQKGTAWTLISGQPGGSGKVGGVVTYNFSFVDESVTSGGVITQSYAGLTFGNVNPDGLNLGTAPGPYPASFISGGKVTLTSKKLVAPSTSYTAGIYVTINPDSNGDGTNVPVVDVIDWNVYALGSWPANTATTGYWALWNINVDSAGVITCVNGTGAGSVSYGYCIGAGANGHYFDPAGPGGSG